MTPALANNHYHQDKSNSKRLLPCDPIGQHFVHYFNHGWSFIEAKVPLSGEKAQWRTECHYPLELPVLWSKYLEEETILGLRFGSFTNYYVLDLDRWSCYHPLNSRERFNDVLRAMEEVGGRRPVIVQSSDSGGIHVYYFLPERVHTFTLAITIKRALNKHKLILVPGRLEIFPNVKGWGSDKVTNYNGHRLPLQHGSYLLDADLEAMSQDIYLFLEQADLSAENQDMAQLNVAIEEAKKHKFYIIQKERSRGEEWCLELQRLISIGWTGFHQTNDQLILLGKYGVIFLKLVGQELRDYMLKAATSSPGYYEYCRHQHEIAKRVGDVAKWAQTYYYAYPDKPIRDKTYREQFYSAEVVYIQDPSQRRHEDCLYRANAVIAMLKGQGVFPDTVMGREKAIIEKSRELFNTGFSPNTLRKDEYKCLWHPLWEVLEIEPSVNADSSVCDNEDSRLVEIEFEKEGEIEVSQSKGLHVLPLYEGILLSEVCGEEANNGTTPTCEEFENEPLGEGEQGLEAPKLVGLNNQSLTKIVSFLDYSINLSLLLIITNLVTRSNVAVSNKSKGRNSLVKKLESNSLSKSSVLSNTNSSLGINTERLLNSNCLNSVNSLLSLIEANFDEKEVQELINYLTELFNQEGQCLKSLKAPEYNTSVRYKQNLFVFLARRSRHVLLPLTASAPMAEETSGRDTSNLEEDNQGEEVTREQWSSMKFKLDAVQKAKKLLKQFSNSLSFSLPIREREAMEKFLRYCLLAGSSFQSLQEEARAWFDASGELISQISGFSSFWDYFEALTF